MKKKNIYLILFVIGTVIPYYEFISFIIENGLDFKLLLNQLFANRISSFFAYDVIISAIVLLILIFTDKNKSKYYWVPLIATITIGVSSGLPLYLFQKECQNDDKILPKIDKRK